MIIVQGNKDCILYYILNTLCEKMRNYLMLSLEVSVVKD